MSKESSGEVTRLLGAVRAGDRAAESKLMDLVHQDLHRIALRSLRGERPDHSLPASALVNEAYLQLFRGMDVSWNDRAHFFAMAATVMRRILVDYGRAKRAQKRGGPRVRVELMDHLAISEDRLDEMLAVDAALNKLAELDPRQSRIVHLRYFGGLTEKETAEALGISDRTVSRDLKFADAWLKAELSAGATS